MRDPSLLLTIVSRQAAGCSSAGLSFGLAALGFASAFSFEGFAPSVRISVIRTRVNSWRWPRLRREFLRRRFLNAITFGPRPCATTSAATDAPDDGRAAQRHAVAADHQHFAELDDLAGLAGDLLDLELVVGGNAILLAAGFDDCEHFSLVFVSGARAKPGPASCSVGLFECSGGQRPQKRKASGPKGPHRAMLMTMRGGAVKERPAAGYFPLKSISWPA